MSDTPLVSDAMCRLVAKSCPDATPTVVRQVLEAAFAAGAAAPALDLLTGGQESVAVWERLAAKLVPQGWHAQMCWGFEPTFVFLPPGKTEEDFDNCTATWLTVDAYGPKSPVVRRGLPKDEDPEDEYWRTYRTAGAAVKSLAA